jgi:hypothetical protein
LDFNTDLDQIEATVLSERKVTCKGQEYSLTKLSRELLNLGYDVNPCGYWLFNGRLLNDIYEETYSME